ncbi:hypothetical protein A9Z42_0013220 [Trichoderma parareesei]|uniref:Uncharacterized protein n=1 Tax=Trichoderma parareesei TaxID=858221 RepID=A0A2H2ZFH0_TRIPA|nr:hypothetical protein A9Z42_0013220 [Trichoderma parareesei]
MAPFTLGIPTNYSLDNLKHEFTILLYRVGSVSFELLAFVISVLWAGMQRRLLLHLTAILSGIQWNDAATRYEDPDSWFREHDYRLSRNSHRSRERLIYIMLYLSMYINFLALGASVSTETFLVRLAIASVPLVLPFRFYLEWPLASKLVLMWWAKITLAETLSWVNSALYLALTVLSMCVLLGTFFELLGRRLEEMEPPKQPHPYILVETWRVSLQMLKDVLPKVWNDVFLDSVLK